MVLLGFVCLSLGHGGLEGLLVLVVEVDIVLLTNVGEQVLLLAVRLPLALISMELISNVLHHGVFHNSLIHIELVLFFVEIVLLSHPLDLHFKSLILRWFLTFKRDLLGVLDQSVFGYHIVEDAVGHATFMVLNIAICLSAWSNYFRADLVLG